MRDPRLVEIDFLMDLDQKGTIDILIHGGESTPRYGTDSGRFRDMILALLAQGYLAGAKLRTYGSSSIDERSLHDERNILMSQLCDRQEIKVRITHHGRVHLWNMRDALLRDHDLDALGFRYRAAWDRDLFLRLRWATPEAPLSVMFLDLDHFKNVNDQHGHPVGDKVLRETGRLMRSVIGVRGEIYRYGGEEIGVLLPATNRDEATRIAGEIRAIIEREVRMQVTELTAPQTACIGVKSFTSVVEDSAAIKEVDELMYKAKRGGRNRVEVGA